MNGFIAVTDPGWYEHLSREPGPKDANFWRPSTRRVRLLPGTPFLFKLKAPHHAIAGFGYFASFSVLPDWLAWETFAEANGVESLAALRHRLGRIRKGARIEAAPGGRIGCCMIAESVFFAPEAWVPPPTTWMPRTQTGATFNLTEGEGQRAWQQCLARAAGRSRQRSEQLVAAEPLAPRYGEPTLHRPRLGQGIFRVQVLDAYGRACSVTGEHSLPVLDAAHIRPYAVGGDHAVPNGMSLRSDLHRLFDRGYITVDKDHRLVVGRRLKDEFDNGRSYYGLHGRELALPHEAACRPDPTELAWHREAVFLG
jgi:putative restriction endonuclease